MLLKNAILANKLCKEYCSSISRIFRVTQDYKFGFQLRVMIASVFCLHRDYSVS